MNPTQPYRPDPALDQLESRLHALIKLRTRMLEAHARLEYLRLMLRLSRRAK